MRQHGRKVGGVERGYRAGTGGTDKGKTHGGSFLEVQIPFALFKKPPDLGIAAGKAEHSFLNGSNRRDFISIA